MKGSDMVIEWQRIRVRPGLRGRFVEEDEKVWTAGLSREPGFLGKEVWLGEDETDLFLVIRWESEEAWKGVSRERLDALDRRFREEVPDGHEIVDSGVYRPAP